jgi:hypothetical protein
MKLRLYLLVAMAFVLLTGTSSCIKKYTCHCDIKYSGAPGLPSPSVQEYSITDSKDAAKSKCSSNSQTYDNGGIHTDENCYLY